MLTTAQPRKNSKAKAYSSSSENRQTRTAGPDIKANDPFIVKNEPLLDPATSTLLAYEAPQMSELAEQRLSQALDAYGSSTASTASVLAASSTLGSSTPLTDSYILGQIAPSANASSPAWSVSSASNNGDYNANASAPLGSPANKTSVDVDYSGLLLNASSAERSSSLANAQEWLAACTREAMFPSLVSAPLDVALKSLSSSPPLLQNSPAFSAANTGMLALPGFSFDSTNTASSAAHTNSLSTTADAALDGWLQQFVNADAISGTTSATAASVAALLSSTTSPETTSFISYALPASQPATFSFETPVASIPVPGMLSLQESPTLRLASSLSPPSSAIDLLDQSAVAAIASAAAAAAASVGSISPDVLASVLSSAAGMCAQDSNIERADLLPPAASDISMLAALPFASVAMPMTNIAPQKTLSVTLPEVSDPAATVPDIVTSESESVVSSLPLPPAKRQRRTASLRKASRQLAPAPILAEITSKDIKLISAADRANANTLSGDENAKETLEGRNPRSNSDIRGAVSKKCATVPIVTANSQTATSNTSLSKIAPAASRAPSGRPIAPSPPRTVSNGSQNMAPLAPRQPMQTASDQQKQQKQQQNVKKPSQTNQSKDKNVAGVAASSESSSRSGSSTPPGLSVLAKIAQRQAPINVKDEDNVSSDTSSANQQQQSQQARLIAPNTTSSHSSTPITSQKAIAGQSSPVNAADAATQKRQERLIKNRAAALLSRKRKREYMTKLESEVEELRDSNSSLVRRLEEMENAMKDLADERDRLRRENEAARTSTATTTSSGNNNSTSSNNATSNSSAKENENKESNESSESNNCKNSDKSVQASDDAMDIDFKDISSSNAAEHQQQQQQSGSSGSSKQRTASTLLMAMLFSFSLFTLPSLYTSNNQIGAGGPQSAGILPIQALPPSEPRLLISSGGSNSGNGNIGGLYPGGSDSKRSKGAAEPPLIERVRRSISALAQQAEPVQEAPQHNNKSDNASNWMRPMTMEESVELHAWIKHGLASRNSVPLLNFRASNIDDSVATQASVDLRDTQTDSTSKSLSVVRHRSPRVNDHAMLYCPVMQHVVFSKDALDVADARGMLVGSNNVYSSDKRNANANNNNVLLYKPSTARVIDTGKQHERSVAIVQRGMDDIDDEVFSDDQAAAGHDKTFVSPRVAAPGDDDWHLDSGIRGSLRGVSAEHVPTQADSIAPTNRPKMSFYSPIVMGRGDGSEAGGAGDTGILPPWEEYARMAAESAGTPGKHSGVEAAAAASGSGSAVASRQKYLRIDVEVVGSRWVTADKFANGLY
ncbi:hypothetical protein GGI25_002038 [Coemansia spiralis]|uniref:BZIP domain-containing protein n=2 Tax=Coemansia TaxID=4863 RepID=A0A9W8G8S5_9FUNG|nr:hypothetical protein EDC05_002649 [Coemansia umbellata]KAJ2623294.1 hypothetical protein GGI26_002522 [Coemansia sp. RSA 1358]KAJ2678845.1 hypothetical protein GGI25_002038 [Coemansia spiralis]